MSDDLVGLVLDVSGSMKRTVPRRSGPSVSLVTSIFNVLDTFVSNESREQTGQVFCFGAGANGEHPAFDLLTTWERARELKQAAERLRIQAEDIGRRARAQIEREKNAIDREVEWLKRSYSYKQRVIVRDILDLLKDNGALYIYGWASVAQVCRIVSLDDAALFLVYLRRDEDFVSDLVDWIPEKCKVQDRPTSSLGYLMNNVGYYGAKAYVTFVSSAEVDSQIGIVRTNAEKYIEAQARERADQIIRQAEYEIRGLRQQLERESTTNPIAQIDIWKAIFTRSRARTLIKGDLRDRLTDERREELLSKIEEYVYGGTPLNEALTEAVEVFDGPGRDFGKKLLFVLSDGMPNGSAPVPIAALRRLDVTVVCCFLSPEDVDGRRLFSVPSPDWSEAARYMFDLSSTIVSQTIPGTAFDNRSGWQIDIDNNETRLFAQVDDTDNINDLIALTNYIVNNPEKMSDFLSLVSLDFIINKANDGFTAPEQEGKTCYANAIAAVMYLAMKRIIGREGGYPFYSEIEPGEDEMNFFELRQKLIDEFGTDKAKTKVVLAKACPRPIYRLRYKALKDEGGVTAVEQAKEALVQGKRPLVARFKLTKKQWQKFGEFFEKNPRGILRRSDLLDGTKVPGANVAQQKPESKPKMFRHAVVFSTFDRDSLRFMSSWGNEWGDSGFFRVENHDVLNMEYFDVYWELDDLLPSEIEAFKREGRKVARRVLNACPEMLDVCYKCDQCKRFSPIRKYSLYRENIERVVCPRCNEVSEPHDSFVMTLYVLSLDPLEPTSFIDPDPHPVSSDDRSECNLL